MTAAFGRSLRATSRGSPNVISSRGSASGAMPCASQTGRMTARSGPAHVHASLFHPQENAREPKMTATSGPYGSTSSESASLSSYLANRLRRRTASVGSTLYRLTWKQRTTPSGRPIFALRASVHRISANGSFSGPTIGDLPCRGWATTTARDGTRGTLPPRPTDAGVPQDQMAALAGWVTASARDWKDTPGMATEAVNPDGSKRTRVDQLPRQALLALGAPVRRTASGEMLTGSSAEMEGGAPLNPEHSRWLMGLPPAWGSCAVMAMQSCPSSHRRSSASSGTPSTRSGTRTPSLKVTIEELLS